jgi:hypothetical protein
MDECPHCRAPIAHGERRRCCAEVREPQESLPGQHTLLSRYCVEVPRASTVTGVDWTLNSTTTDCIMKAVAKGVTSVKSVVFGRKIDLKWSFCRMWYLSNDDKIDISKSVYSQITSLKRLGIYDALQSVDVCSGMSGRPVSKSMDIKDPGRESTLVVHCTIKIKESTIEFDRECKNAIATAIATEEAKKSGKKPIWLLVNVGESELATAEREEQEQLSVRRAPALRKLEGMKRPEIEHISAKMNDIQRHDYFVKYGVITPFALLYPGEPWLHDHPSEYNRK